MPVDATDLARLLPALRRFVDEECVPAERTYVAQVHGASQRAGGSRWSEQPPVMEELKRRAKELGLWNLLFRGINVTGKW